MLEPMFISKEGKRVGVAVAALILIPAFLSFFLHVFGIVSDVFVTIVIGADLFFVGIIVTINLVVLTKIEKRIKHGDLSPPGRFIKICYGALLGAIVGFVGVALILLKH